MVLTIHSIRMQLIYGIISKILIHGSEFVSISVIPPATVRILNVDIMKYKSRIYDIHIKDVDKAAKEGTTVEMGRGIIDIPEFVETLRKINYTGSCSLEFEKDMKDSLPGIAESIGYFKGVMACK